MRPSQPRARRRCRSGRWSGPARGGGRCARPVPRGRFGGRAGGRRRRAGRRARRGWQVLAQVGVRGSSPRWRAVAGWAPPRRSSCSSRWSTWACPVWVRGGIGVHTAAAVVAGGGPGVLLDAQLGLLREGGLGVDARRALEAMDGSETRVVGGHRFFTRPDLPAAALPETASAAEVAALMGADLQAATWCRSARTAASPPGLARPPRHRRRRGAGRARRAVARAPRRPRPPRRRWPRAPAWPDPTARGIRSPRDP
jgi:hypothetical protein